MSGSRPDSTSHREVQREVKVHGERWRTMYGGYFSSLESARPLLEVVNGVIEREKRACPLTRDMNRRAVNNAVGTREINIFKKH